MSHLNYVCKLQWFQFLSFYDTHFNQFLFLNYVWILYSFLTLAGTPFCLAFCANSYVHGVRLVKFGPTKGVQSIFWSLPPSPISLFFFVIQKGSICGPLTVSECVHRLVSSTKTIGPGATRNWKARVIFQRRYNRLWLWETTIDWDSSASISINSNLKFLKKENVRFT